MTTLRLMFSFEMNQNALTLRLLIFLRIEIDHTIDINRVNS